MVVLPEPFCGRLAYTQVLCVLLNRPILVPAHKNTISYLAPPVYKMSFPYPVRALRVRLLVAPGGPGMAYGFLPLRRALLASPPGPPERSPTANQELRDQIAT